MTIKLFIGLANNINPELTAKKSIEKYLALIGYRNLILVWYQAEIVDI